MNATPFGTDHTFDELIEKLKGADLDNSSPNDLQKFIIALKILSEETIARHESVRKLENDLREKLTLASLYENMDSVLGNLREAQPIPRRVKVFGKFGAYLRGE